MLAFRWFIWIHFCFRIFLLMCSFCRILRFINSLGCLKMKPFYLSSHLSKLTNSSSIMTMHIKVKVSIYWLRCFTMCQPRSVKLFWKPCYLGNGDDMFLKQLRKWRHRSVDVAYLSKYSQLVQHWRHRVYNFCSLFQNSLKNLKLKKKGGGG